MPMDDLWYMEQRFQKQKMHIEALRAYILQMDEPSTVAMVRKSGIVGCTICGKQLYNHPQHPRYEFLNITCEGELVKL